MKRALFCALALCACAAPIRHGDDGPMGERSPDAHTARGPVPAGSRSLTTREWRTIQDLMEVTERVRDLDFETPVPVQVQDADAIMAYFSEQIDDDELRRAQIVYTALGLLEPGLDVRQMLISLMERVIMIIK